MRKRLRISLSLLFVLMLTLVPVSQTLAAGYSFYEEDYSVYVDGSRVSKAVKSGKHLLLPLKDITLKVKGAYVFQDVKNSSNDVALVSNYGIGAAVKVGQLYIDTWEGRTYLPVSPKVINGQMYVPAVVLEKALNTKVEVFSSSEKVIVTSEEKYYKTVVKDRIPTVFMHGWLGGEDTFTTMLNSLTGAKKLPNLTDKNTSHKFTYNGQHATIFVDKYGKPHTHVFGMGSENKWFVTVVFENNKASLDDQARWFKAAMVEVKKMYKTSKVKLVTHSMGGLVATRYIEDTSNIPTNSYVMKVNKLVTLGSPIMGTRAGGFVKDGLRYNQVLKDPAILFYEKLTGMKFSFEGVDAATKDLMPKSKALVDLQNRRNYFDKDTKVLSVAGTYYSALGDGVVTLDSAYGLRNIVSSSKIQTVSYPVDHEKTHDDSRIIAKVKGFMWY